MTTKTTVLNVTNHTYFNLGDNDTIVDHWVELPSKRTTEVDEALIPTGRVITVEGTPLDLINPTRLGEVLDRCPGGDYAGFSHTYMIEANVTEENNGKMTEKILKENNLALCGTVEERTRFCHNCKMLYFHFLLLQRPWGQSTYKPTRGNFLHWAVQLFWRQAFNWTWRPHLWKVFWPLP